MTYLVQVYTNDIFSRGGRKSKGLDDLFATEVPKAKPTVKEVKSEKVVREEPKREDVGGREEIEQPHREEVDAPQPKPKTEKVSWSVTIGSVLP